MITQQVERLSKGSTVGDHCVSFRAVTNTRLSRTCMQMNQMEFRSPVATGHNPSCPDLEGQTERLNSRPAGRWLHVDLLEWMGDIMAAPTGRICCPSTGCG